VSSATGRGPTTRALDADSIRWRRFAVIAVVQFLVVVDTTVVYVALPSIAHELAFNHGDLAWVMDAYMLGLGGFLLVGGRIADAVGRRRLLTIGLVAFGVASAACAAAATPWMLIGGRALQGVSAAMITPAAMALISDLFPEGPARYKAYGIFGGIGGIAGASGALVGGVLTSFAWQWVFLVNLPVVVLVLTAGIRLLPAVGHPSLGRADIVGATCVTGSLTLILFAAVQLGVGHVTLGPLVALVVGTALMIVFVVRQMRVRDPLVPPVLYHNRPIAVGNVVNGCVGFLMFGGFYMITLYLQNGRGLSAMGAALFMLPVSLLIFAGSQAGIRLLASSTPARLLRLGLVVQFAALGSWALVLPAPESPTWGYFLPGGIWALGLGMSIVAVFVLCTSGVAGPLQGVASGLVNTTLQLGGAIGVAVLGIVAGLSTGGGLTGYHFSLVAAAIVALIGALLALATVPPVLPRRAASQTFQQDPPPRAAPREGESTR
jgi:MFS family permease